MTQYKYPFAFSEDASNPIKGQVELEQPLPYQSPSGGSGFYRPGRLELSDGNGIDLVLYHNPYTAHFIYIRDAIVDRNLLELTGISLKTEVKGIDHLRLPGQLCMGSERTALIGKAVEDIIASPALRATITPVTSAESGRLSDRARGIKIPGGRSDL